MIDCVDLLSAHHAAHAPPHTHTHTHSQTCYGRRETSDRRELTSYSSRVTRSPSLPPSLPPSHPPTHPPTFPQALLQPTLLPRSLPPLTPSLPQSLHLFGLPFPHNQVLPGFPLYRSSVCYGELVTCRYSVCILSRQHSVGQDVHGTVVTQP